MSTELLLARVRLVAARAELAELCQGKQWHMRIPANELDSDVIFAKALDSLETLIEEIIRLEVGGGDG